MGTTFDAVGQPQRPSDGDVSWRDDPFVLELMPADLLAESPPAEPSTFVLIDGAVATVAMTRWEAIDAGYAVLDDDAPVPGLDEATAVTFPAAAANDPYVAFDPDDFMAEAVVAPTPEPEVDVASTGGGIEPEVAFEASESPRELGALEAAEAADARDAAAVSGPATADALEAAEVMGPDAADALDDDALVPDAHAPFSDADGVVPAMAEVAAPGFVETEPAVDLAMPEPIEPVDALPLDASEPSTPMALPAIEPEPVAVVSRVEPPMVEPADALDVPEPEPVGDVDDQGTEGTGDPTTMLVGTGVAVAPAPASRSRADVNDWLRSISRAAHGPSPANGATACPHPAMISTSGAIDPSAAVARSGTPATDAGPTSADVEPGTADVERSTAALEPGTDLEPVVTEAEPTPAVVTAAGRSTGPAAPVLIAARGLSKRYARPNGSVDALVDVDIEIHQGEMLAVSGPSGSGKTTLLYCLSGLEEFDHGEVVVAGEAMHLLTDAEKTALRARTMGFIFQTYHLVEHMTAVENVEMPLRLNGWDATEARAEAMAALDAVGLAERADHQPGELSGGEQQRVTVARALVGDPQILWADEPTGNLDEGTAAIVIDLLRARHAAGLTVVLVTHDAALASSATRQIVMGAGRLVPDTLTVG